MRAAKCQPARVTLVPILSTCHNLTSEAISFTVDIWQVSLMIADVPASDWLVPYE